MYTVLNNALQVKGKLSLNNGQGSTAFFSDVITQQMATDNSTDPDSMTSIAFNATDKVGNTKQWGHSLSINVEATDLGTSISTNDYLMYFDQVANHYYLMKVLTVGGDRTTGYLAIDGINTAIYELGKQFPVAKTYTQANLETVVKDVYENVPFLIRIEDDLETVIDYTVAEKTSAQAILQDLQTKYDVDVDSWIELDNSGNITERVLYFGHLGSNNGELIRYGGAKGFENMSAQEVSDTIYTKLYVVGQTDDKDPNKGHIASVNNGMDYIVDDEANASLYAIGASQNQPNYLEGTITSTLLSEPRALLTWAQAQMGIFNHPRFNYTVSPMHDQIVGIGDSITVQDFHMKPMILVNSKVIQKTSSFASPETNTFVLGEFSNIFTENANKGAGVINLIKKDVTVVQEAADNARVAADEAHKQAVAAQQQAIKAQTSADEKGVVLTVSNFDDLPETADEGTQAWVNASDGIYHYVFVDGQWKEDISPTMQKDITDKVTTSLTEAKNYSDKLVADNNTQINNTINEVAQEKIDLAIKDADFNNKAQAIADKALSDAKANTVQVAQETLKSANDSIAQAKYAITDAYKNADGVISKKVDDTATSIGNTISQNKIDSDGKISTAQSTATQALNEVITKVSQTVYDQKTGDLTTAVSKAQTTADGVVTTVGNYKTSNDKRVQAAESTIEQHSKDITARVTKTDYDKATGKISGDISTLQQRADGFDATVTKVNNLSVGSRNYLTNSSGVSLDLWNQTDGWSIATGTNRGSVFSIKPTSNWSGGNRNALSKSGLTIPSGTEVTVSFWAKADVDGANLHSEPNGGYKLFNVKLSTIWTKYSYTFTLTSTVLYFMAIDAGKTYYLDDIKLETGNIATDWTPAPEDIESALAQVKITADSVSSIVSNPTTGLSVRVQTAEGTLSKVQGTDIPALQNATFWQPYSSLNFNDYTKQGSFFFNTTAAKTNSPTTSTAYTYLIVEQGTSDSSRIKQIAWYDGVAGVKITYVRTLNSGTWSPWYANDNDSVTTISQTNSDIKQEIQDRTNGDSNTLQSSKEFTQSSITSSERGMKSLITQTSNSVIAQVNSINLINNSEFDNVTGTFAGWHMATPWGASVTNQLTQQDYAYASVGSYLWPQASKMVSHNYSTSTPRIYSDPVRILPNKKLSGSLTVANPASATTNIGLAIYVVAFDANQNQIGNIWVKNITAVSGAWTVYSFDGAVTPAGTVYVSMGFTWNDGMGYFGQPMLQVNNTYTGYTPNVAATSTVLSLFKDNWSIGISDNIGNITSGIVDNASQMSLISKKVVIDSPSTQINGKAWIQSADIANGAIGTVQIGDAAITSAKIANLDVSKLTGDTITGFNFNVNRSLTVAPGGTITSDIVKMTKTNFSFYAQNVSNTRTSSASYKIGQFGTFDLDAIRGSLQSIGTLQVTAPGTSSAYRTGTYLTAYGTENLVFSTDNWSNGDKNEMANLSSNELVFNKDGFGIQANQYSRIQANYISTTGDISANGKVMAGNLALDVHTIHSYDGGKLWMSKQNGDTVDLGVKSLSQSSLVSLKEHISKVTPGQLLSETLRADIRSYNFTGDDITDRHVTPMIDDVDHAMYIPNDWLSPEGTGVDTYSIIGYLIGSVKALQEQITELKANQ